MHRNVSKIDFFGVYILYLTDTPKGIFKVREVEVMEVDKMTLDEIYERVKAECLEECRAKAETEYLLQKSKNEMTNDEER